MKKKITLICIMLVLSLNAICAYALKYEPPYDETDSRLYRTMPAPFSIDNFKKELKASNDFNLQNTGGGFDLSYGGSYWSETDGCYKISKTQTGDPLSFAFRYTPTEVFKEGDFYAFSCRIKTEDINEGAPLNILEAYGTKWLAAAQDYNGTQNLTGDNDWYEMTQVLEIPQNTVYLNLQGYLEKNMTGTVYFDDFKLYKVCLDPLESVLLSPNYKGLIYGDGDSDINLDVAVYERDGFYDFEDFEVYAFLKDENDKVMYSSKAEKVTEKMNFVFSLRGLANGDYFLEVTLVDEASKNVISTKEHTIRKRGKDYRPENYIDEKGHLIENGSKKFIKRIYNHSANGKSNYLTSAQFAKETGISSISNYGMWWAVTNPETEAFSYIRDNGLKTHISLSSYWFSDRGNNEAKKLIQKQSDILPLFNKIASDYKNDEIFDGYYIFDEPNPLLVGEEIRWNNEILAEADINHPTLGVADKEFERYGIYTKMTDILGIDPYPVTGKTDENGNPTYDISKVGKGVKAIKNNFPNRPVYLVMQGFHYKSRGDLRSPDYLELKNMAWQAIAEGAEGLDWYAYPEMTTDTTKDLQTWQSEIKNVLSGIKEYENVIMSDEPAPLYTVDGGGEWLNISVKRYEGKTYVFAVNNTYTDKYAEVDIKGTEKMSLSFTPLEVKLLEIEQADFLSPEAELKAMGFSNGSEVFAVAENGEENILYVKGNNGVINYSAKISENASLYIGNKKVPLKGKITVKNANEIKVCVVSESGEVRNETIFKVVRQGS